jgi:glucokinase
MMTEVINIISPFLAFASTYNQAKAHNMLAIMLNLHFKNMKVINDFAGHAHIILNVIEYDVNIVCPFYYMCFFI